MVLSCIGSEHAVLQYLAMGSPEVKILTTAEYNYYHADNLYLFEIYRAQNPNNPLTWEWSEIKGYRRWLAQLKGQRAAYSNCGETFFLERQFRQSTTSIEIVQEDYQLILYIAPPESPDYNSGIGRPIYQSGRYLLAKAPSCGNYNGFYTLSLEVASIAPHPGSNSKWLFRVFDNGIEIARREVWGYMNTAPTYLIETYDKEGFYPASKSFSKQLNSEALELIPVANQENEWQIWRVFLDAEQNPVNSELIYHFQGKAPELFCLEENECPENTCKVDCGAGYCCYSSAGISVHSFLKT